MAQQSCIRLISIQQECTLRAGTTCSTQCYHPELTLASDCCSVVFNLRVGLHWRTSFVLVSSFPTDTSILLYKRILVLYSCLNMSQPNWCSYTFWSCHDSTVLGCLALSKHHCSIHTSKSWEYKY